MQVNVTNNSGVNVYAIVYGRNIHTDRWSFFSNGSITEATIGMNVQPYWSTIVPGAPLAMPSFQHLKSGIILLCYSQYPNIFGVVKDGNGNPAIQAPPFLPGSGDANTIFTMVEFTYNDAGFNVDTTLVDFFTVPVEIELIGAGYDKKAGAMIGTRHEIFKKYDEETTGTPFNGLIMKNGGTNVRILGPQHGVDAGIIPANIYDGYVAKCWSHYEHNTLNVSTTYGSYTGTVVGGILTFTGHNNFTVPTPGPGLAGDIFGCSGTLSAPNNEYGAIVAVIGAALNRTVLFEHETHPFCVSSDFYKDPKYPTNHYSHVIHEMAAGGHAYAFPFDDVCGYSSDIGCGSPETLNVTLGLI